MILAIVNYIKIYNHHIMNNNIYHKIISNKKSFIIGIIVCFLVLIFGYWGIEIYLLEMNFGIEYAIIHIILHILIAILLGRLMMIIIYKIDKQKEIKDKKTGLIWIVASVIWIVFTWCPVCGITLVSMLGISSIITILPWSGLELKLLSVFLLFWTQDILIANIDWCRLMSGRRWIGEKKTIISWLLLVVSIVIIAYLIKPKTSIELIWDISLVPSSDYIVYSYDLKDWCSDTSYFVESYTKTSKETKILWLKIYDNINLKKYDICSEELWLKKSFDIDDREEITDEYQNWLQNNQLKKINNIDYLVRYKKCDDYNKSHCLWWEYRFSKNHNLYMIYVNTISDHVISVDRWSVLLDKELEKWYIRI